MSFAIYPWCYVRPEENHKNIHTLQCPLANLKLEGKIIHCNELTADYMENPIYDAFAVMVNQKTHMLWGNNFNRINVLSDRIWLGTEYGDNFLECVRSNSEIVWWYEERIKFHNKIQDDIYRLFIFE